MSARRGPDLSASADDRSVWSMLVPARAFGGAGRGSSVERVLTLLSDALREDERELHRLEHRLADLRVSAAFSLDLSCEDAGNRPGADRALRRLESRLVKEELRYVELSTEIHFLSDIAVRMTDFLEARRRAG